MSNLAGNLYYLGWVSVCYRYGFVKDRCCKLRIVNIIDILTYCIVQRLTLFLAICLDRSTIATSYHAKSGFRDDSMTGVGGVLWRYFEHWKFFFELLDLTVRVCLDD